jgi:hypothetical protein
MGCRPYLFQILAIIGATSSGFGSSLSTVSALTINESVSLCKASLSNPRLFKSSILASNLKEQLDKVLKDFNFYIGSNNYNQDEFYKFNLGIVVTKTDLTPAETESLQILQGEEKLNVYANHHEKDVFDTLSKFVAENPTARNVQVVKIGTVTKDVLKVEMKIPDLITLVSAAPTVSAPKITAVAFDYHDTPLAQQQKAWIDKLTKEGYTLTPIQIGRYTSDLRAKLGIRN